MPKQWILLNELVFSVYESKRGSLVRVTLENADKEDEQFMSLIARLIAEWIAVRRKHRA